MHLVDKLIEKEMHCPTLCVDCKKRCKLYEKWLALPRRKWKNS